MLKKLKRQGLFLFFLTVLLTACSGNNTKVIDGDTNISKEMHEVISNYITQHYSNTYLPTEKNFEVHKIYGTSETKDRINVYMHSYFGGFNKSTGLESQAGHSLPAVIQLKKESAGYTVVDYKEPKVGSDFSSSLKKCFQTNI